jgi:pimeloyl-ACP methyl ester carboxylesterase
VYLDAGAGEPLVLLHGFGAEKDNWLSTAWQLRGRYRVLALDVPGFGESSQDPEASYAYEQQVARMAAFLDAVGLAAPVHIGGNSMGGGIAGFFAARYPERVKSLWLIAPAGVASAAPSDLFRAIVAGQNPMLTRSTEDFDRLMDMIFVRRPYIPGAVMRIFAEKAAGHRRFNEKIFGDIRQPLVPLEVALKGSAVPTLILWGDHDRLVDVSGAAILGAVMPRSRVVVLKDVGHSPMIEEPRASAEAFLAFQNLQR